MRYILILLLAGCASQPLTPAEQEAKEMEMQEFMDDYHLCQAIYNKSPSIWVSHTTLRRGQSIRYSDARYDYFYNGCPSIVKTACKRGTLHERC